ncbi:MAG TPA: glycerol-3-phosphate 1-O-acyltransferase PlsY [Chthoniobacterales bacterium]|nr:glycerol-3-phosphate 1-O-acyltransferase PlsY [Chthoniobacterales bacterium]
MWFLVLACCAIGYFFGAFPAGYFAGRLTGVDIRSKGSGNIGATNVLRVLGKRWGYTVFAIDALKGFAAVRLAFFLARFWPAARPYAEYFAILTAIISVVGHMFPVWLGFKGGKGVATSAGALFGLMPWAVPCVFLLWYITFQISRYVSLASIVAAISLPIVVSLFVYWKFLDNSVLINFSLLITLLVLWQHRSNFSRLLKGTEQRFSRK